MNARAPWDVPATCPLSTRIVTDRLILRPPRTADVPRMRLSLRKNAAHLRPWSASQMDPEDPASLTAVSRAVLRHRREWKLGQTYVFLVFLRPDENAIVGRLALGGVLRGAFQNAYLGYWIDADHQRKGLMTEAVMATTAFAFGPARLHRVQAAVMPRNAPSQRVLEKAGYRREGVAQSYLSIAGRWEDHVLFAMTLEEWPRALPPDPG